MQVVQLGDCLLLGGGVWNWISESVATVTSRTHIGIQSASYTTFQSPSISKRAILIPHIDSVMLI